MQMHHKYMQRAIDLARLGAGKVSPNPMVGAVIVCDDKIIGEGWHQQYGGPHAEVHALAAVTDKSLLSKSTIYVSLEPCSHYGKTPPCANAIIESGIKTVMVGINDPNPLVAGKGIQLLKEKGIEVIENVLRDECIELNKRFLTYITHKRPYIILKWAQTANHFIAPDITALSAEEFEKQRHITGLLAQKLTHKWRTTEDALMVGTNTIVTDNPKLNARAWHGKNPTRVVLDLKNRLDKRLNVFDGSEKTLVFNATNNLHQSAIHNTTFIGLDTNKNLPKQIIEQLYTHHIQSVIIEGGSQLLQTFIHEQLWDEAQILVSPKSFVSGVKAPSISGQIIQTFSLDQNTISIIKRA
jgi:diaminohydroxyphosphoribosylaminopyrimidine deaminase/5-amino-6-(5-phosphoribosylamino)uracil reductase